MKKAIVLSAVTLACLFLLTMAGMNLSYSQEQPLVNPPMDPVNTVEPTTGASNPMTIAEVTVRDNGETLITLQSVADSTVRLRLEFTSSHMDFLGYVRGIETLLAGK